MAIRNMLHMSQLKAFEALRAQKPKKDRKPKESPVIVYRKGGAKEHLSIMDKDFYLVNEFLRTKEAE